MTHLRARLVDLHQDPGRIEHDEELAELLLPLYVGVDAEHLWAACLEPYLREHEAGLRTVWGEHAADPSWTFLDCPEALLVFERAERDREHLRRVWPGPQSWLSRISDVWGVPL